jgi:hypothetical protein
VRNACVANLGGEDGTYNHGEPSHIELYTSRLGVAFPVHPCMNHIFEYLRWGYVPTGEDFVQLSIYDTEYNGRLMIYYGPDRNAGFRLWTSPDHPSFDTL